MKPTILSLITFNQFTCLDSYNHLSTFYELCETMGISEDEEATYLRLFPFSLIGKVNK